MNNGCFKPGHVPANKGKKIEEFMTPERALKFKATQFKKGHIPKNTLQDYTITERKDKNGYIYKWIRISKNNWKMLHVYNWEKVHGKVPQGYIVVIKSTDKRNCEVENLELITRKENIHRNHIGRYPKDIRSAMITLGKFKSKVKSYAKKQN